MNAKACATSDEVAAWNQIDWQKAVTYVKKLQKRIVKNGKKRPLFCRFRQSLKKFLQRGTFSFRNKFKIHHLTFKTTSTLGYKREKVS